MRPPEPLGPQHQLERFDCGNAALNRWLQQRAMANERQGVSRTVVICLDGGSDVIAYACLSAGAILLADVPGALRRNMPDPFPVVVLGLTGGGSSPVRPGAGLRPRRLLKNEAKPSLRPLHVRCCSSPIRLIASKAGQHLCQA